MLQAFWGVPIVVYLFLGGLSGGVSAICALDCLHSGALRARALKCSLAVSIAALLVGACSLFLDLGRPGHALTPALLVHGGSWISRGVWIICLSILADLLFAMVISRRCFHVLEGLFPGYRSIRDRLADLAACLVLLLGCALSAYTGFLLSSSLGVPFWNTPLLPLLFVAASLNVGVSFYRCAASLCRCEVPMRSFGIVLLALEIVVLLVFLGFNWLSGSWFARASVSENLAGGLAPVFWLGVVGVGYLAVMLAKARPSSRWSLVIEMLCALAGMFCLRWCVVFCAYVSI